MKPDEMPEAPVCGAGSDAPVSEAAPGPPAACRPRVVIAGRPNVGKSTLFNRLYGRRRAITDPLAGVTRDAIGEDCSLAGIPITLIDTGGVKAEYEDDFDEIVSHRALGALDTAHLILFVVEIGVITPEDEMLIETLRKVSTRVIPVANKADTPEKDYLAAELYARGIGDPLPVSAAHGRGGARPEDRAARGRGWPCSLPPGSWNPLLRGVRRGGAGRSDVREVGPSLVG